MSRTRATTTKISSAAPIFTALGDETRLYIVSRLCREGPLSISRLTTGTRISRQAITKHLNVLADAGLARSERSGRERIWEVEGKQLAEAHRYLGEISAQWDEALTRLRMLVEEGQEQDATRRKARRR